MAKKLDAQRIEKARTQTSKRDKREEEKRHIRDTIAKNRSGERKGRVIMPEKKLYAYEEAPKIRVRHTAVSAQRKKRVQRAKETLK